MSRFNQILIVALIIQLALGAFIFWPKSVAQGTSGPLLADFSATGVVELTIHDSDDNRIVLAKSGDDWALPEADDFPADSEKISPLLEKIEGVQDNRLVTQTEASHKRLKVAENDFNRLLEIKLEDGTRHKLYLGSSGGAGATHVRVDDRPEVYLTDQINSYEARAQASGWIDTLYYTIPQTSTVALTLENANGTFEFEKDGENWGMRGLTGGEIFNENSLTTLLNQATSIRMVAPIGKAEQPLFGLDRPRAVVTLKTQVGTETKTYTLRVGAKDDEDNSYVVSYSESPYYVRASEITGNNFVEKSRDDFLEAEPTPEAEDASSDAAESQ